MYIADLTNKFRPFTRPEKIPSYSLINFCNFFFLCQTHFMTTESLTMYEIYICFMLLRLVNNLIINKSQYVFI